MYLASLAAKHRNISTYFGASPQPPPLGGRGYPNVKTVTNKTSQKMTAKK